MEGATGSSKYEHSERSRSYNNRNWAKNNEAPLNVVGICNQCTFCTDHPGSSERGHEATLASGWRGKVRWVGTRGDEALLDPTEPGADWMWEQMKGPVTSSFQDSLCL